MPSLIQRAFAGGEVAPAVYGRADQVKYQTGLRTCRNFIVRRHGGVSNRPGTQMIVEQKVSSARGRLMKFVFNADQTYVLLFENQTLRFIKNGALLNVASVLPWASVVVAIQSFSLANPCVLKTATGHGLSTGQSVTLAGILSSVTTKSITGATNAAPIVITAVAHGFTNGQIVRINSVGGMTQINNLTFTVANATTDTFELQGTDGTIYGVYTSGGNVFLDGTNWNTLNGQTFVVTVVDANNVSLGGLNTTAFSPYLAGAGTATQINYAVGDLVVQGGVNYYCILANGGFAPPNALYWYPLTGTIYEIPTPYLTADLQALRQSESADVITLTHPSYGIYNLSRTGDTKWTLKLSVQAPSIAAPASPVASGGTGTGKDFNYVVTAVKAETFEESNPSVTAALVNKADPTSANPNVLTWTAVTGAQEYNVYRQRSVPTGTGGNGIYGFIGVASSTRFNDDNSVIPDFTTTPPMARDPFVGAGNFPSVSGYYQQRKWYANTTLTIEGIWSSRSGQFNNFSESVPLQDNDAVTFIISGQQVNAVRAMAEVAGSFVILTDGGIWVPEGDANGTVTPSAVNPRRRGAYGSSSVPPVIVGSGIVYVQARGSFVRELKFESTFIRDPGRDLSVYAPHLVEGFTIEHLDYAQIPNSIIWVQRSDGTLLGLTYMPEQEVWGWHRHDTAGFFEDVVVVPEGQEDAVYVLVNRTIQGMTRRYVERFSSRRVTDVTIDAHFLDAYLTYDGRNTTAITMTLTGGTLWDGTEELTLMASAAYFVAGDVGKAIMLTVGAATVTLAIDFYSSATVVQGHVNKIVPTTLRMVATAVWSKAVSAVGGLSHLEGQVVGILGDGNVITNGQDAPFTTVVGGVVSLGGFYAVIHAGLPITADFELLDLEVLGGETIADKLKEITSVTLFVEASRGIWAGIDVNHLIESKQRKIQTVFNPTIPVVTDKVEVSMGSTWNKTGRVFVRVKDPLPLTILQAIPNGPLGG